MASVPDEDDRALGSAPKMRGRGRAWLPDENISVVLAACHLPDASIDGANMRAATYEQKIYSQFVKHAPSLEELPDQSKLWRGRSPRSCLDQWKRIQKDCTSLHGRLQQVQRANPTGNPSEADMIRVAVGLFNKEVTLSDMYLVIQNRTYNIGKRFFLMNCYEVMRERFPTRLEPTSIATTSLGVERGGITQEADVGSAGGGDANESDGGPAGAPRSRPQGSKAAKRARRRQSAAGCDTEDQDSVSIALSSYTAAYKDVSDRSLAQSTETSQAKRLRAGAASLKAGLDAYKTLFFDGTDASTAECHQYRELLRQQAMQQARRAILLPIEAQGTGESMRQDLALCEVRSSSSSERRDRNGSPAKPDALSQLPGGFRCAASCRYAELPMPLSVCPRPQCDRDERGSGRVHDLCALNIWLRCGKMWDEPTTIETKFCSEECFNAVQLG
jgi:hypothetical protein